MFESLRKYVLLVVNHFGRNGLAYSLLTILCLWNYNAEGQSLNDLQNYVTDKDKSAVSKSIDKIKQADELTREANEYYNEALELQSNYELDEKTLQKQLDKAEGKALSTQMQADKIYSSAYQSLYELSVKNLEASSTISYGDPEIYIKTAEEMMENASLKRKEALGTDNPYEQAAMLNDAAGMENTAIENMIFAFKAQSGEAIVPTVDDQVAEEYTEYQEPEYSYTEETSYQEEITQVNENLAVNQTVVKKYDDYVSDESIPDPIMVSGAGVVGVSEVSVDEARKVLHRSVSGDIYATYSEPEAVEPEPQDSMIYPETQEYVEPAQEEYYPEEQYTEYSPPVTESVQTREAYDISAVTQSTGVRFMVQLAASRIPITRPQMKAIYKGSMTIEVVREDDWYKYRITGFRLFSEANRVAKQSGVRSAWVLAANDGNPVNLVEAREMSRVLEADVKRRGKGAIENGNDFYVQVMASKVRISENEMQSICGYSGNCREIIEESWFKYQVFAGTDYQAALSLKSQIPGKSFIVAYKDGAKYNLYKAIHNK